MNYIEFRNKMEPFGVFSITDIEKMFPGFVWLNLINWQKKGYILKIRKRWYCFNYDDVSKNVAWLAANLIYQPSYISLQTALSFYGLIPEAIYTVTSVSTKKTNYFETPIGTFSYSKIKSTLFRFGQTLTSSSSYNLPTGGKYKRKELIAEPEKAILDFFYIYSHYNTYKDMEYLRFDPSVLNDSLDMEKLFRYLEQYNNKALNDRIDKLLSTYRLI
jgi:predicted transcriptional regulator of viral defense system